MLAGGIVVVVAAIAMLLLGVWWFSDRTFCAGVFRSGEQAGGAIVAATEVGFSFDERRVERRRDRIVVTVRTGRTGDDAEELRAEWRRILNQYEGREGNPGGGCWERGVGD
jgi:hypothetical protein